MQTGNSTRCCCLVAALLLLAGNAQAAISTDISIAGTGQFDEAYASSVFGALGEASATQFGEYYTISGGTPNYPGYDGSMVSGDNPVAVNLTEIGDAFGFSGAGSAGGEEAYLGAAIDFDVTASNSSATRTYEIRFSVLLRNGVDAQTADGFSESAVAVSVGGVEAFASALLSDPVFGDENPVGTKTGTFGEPQADMLDDFLTLVLTPGQSAGIAIDWISHAEDFGLGEVSLGTDVHLQLLSVIDITEEFDPPPGTPVPGPTPLMLLACGTALLAYRRRPRAAPGQRG